jgi:transcriptional regulator with XRE-family HTH domain
MNVVPTAALEGLIARKRARALLPSHAERRRIREDAGCSLRNLADVLPVHPSTLHNWERGLKEPNDANAVRYAWLLDQLRASFPTTTGPSDLTPTDSPASALGVDDDGCLS